ncbi:hypothetical protein AbraIFM66951_009147 [Aspergillus brasiliensis]|uniref:Uncharacterized protein n=1 Tax=Aspergillus brasiliensis TaxID=319629 RepID=A0A9W6DR14_9EURO|nr:hypothetical protein AbraCBS73388_010521 [Aspergillus brasiliensis]GKZ46236.1 hypothetical protein AbraIFM66951_009147 [Aspergillus brasiliensis]
MPRREYDPRQLVFRHARRCQQFQTGAVQGLQPGEERLYAFLQPGLRGGKYTIDVQQKISVDDNSGKPVKKTLPGTQQFYVDFPEFQLPDGEVHSVYPPEGHEERAECLPHVVLNTPTMPWEWEASNIHDTTDFKENRNRVPWLAVLVFTKEELQLAPSDLKGDQSLFKGIPGFEDGAKQGPTFAIHMKVDDVKKIKSTQTPMTTPPLDQEVSTDMILLQKDLFRSLFEQNGPDGEPVGSSNPNVRPYRFLAHRRDINADGMAVASTLADDHDQASFSVVFSHRTGPVDMKVPTACIAHLVSIRGVESMNWPTSDVRFVALSTLHSWTYTGLPPETPSVRDMFEKLGNSSTVLQPPLVSAKDLDPKTPLTVRERLAARLHDGYTLARYRMQTGERTACFFRGPLIPVKIPETAVRSWSSLSTSGQDLQIMDQALGLMDISCSAAWQLGRTLAMADQEFITRIGLVRKHIYDRGLELSQLQALKPHQVCSHNELLAQLPQIVSDLHQLPRIHRFAIDNGHDQIRRWYRPPVEPVDLSYQGRKTADLTVNEEPTKANFIDAAMEVSSAANADGSPSKQPYNEYNVPYSPDWMAVLKWVLNRLFLATIPHHYLLPESSALPHESIRFFRIDWRWMDALIDGALSLANHHDQSKDLVRDAIWAAIRRYRETAVKELGNMLPSVPEYGCYIRSTLISKFPDLRVHVDSGQSSPKPLVLLRHDIISSDTMLCLFSHKPGSPEFQKLYLIQPPHQQTFVAAATLDQQHIKMAYRKAYTVHVNQPDGNFLAEPDWPRPQKGSSVSVYSWETAQGVKTHRLIMENLAKDYLSVAQKKMDPSLFKETTATSTLMAWQLGSISYRLKFTPPTLTDSHLLRSDIAQNRPQPRLPPAVPLDTPWRPAYHYRISPVGNPTSTKIPMLPIQQDLLFLINLEPHTDQQNYLEEIQFSFPLGKAGPGAPVLMQNYTGTGAEMITNIRFNVLLNIVTSEVDKSLSMVLRLLPRVRSKDGGKTHPRVPLRSCHELSFVLNGVLVNRYKQNTTVKYTVLETYAGQASMGPYYELPPIELVLPQNS